MALVARSYKRKDLDAVVVAVFLGTVAIADRDNFTENNRKPKVFNTWSTIAISCPIPTAKTKRTKRKKRMSRALVAAVIVTAKAATTT